ncbi:MAG: hypothetical protein HY556_05010 [Euryarchaeota archaeon]|nr:hypothetical protein [Euryarchaeota archaeon]
MVASSLLLVGGCTSDTGPRYVLHLGDVVHEFGPDKELTLRWIFATIENIDVRVTSLTITYWSFYPSIPRSLQYAPKVISIFEVLPAHTWKAMNYTGMVPREHGDNGFLVKYEIQFDYGWDGHITSGGTLFESTCFDEHGNVVDQTPQPVQINCSEVYSVGGSHKYWHPSDERWQPVLQECCNYTSTSSQP